MCRPRRSIIRLWPVTLLGDPRLELEEIARRVG